MALSTCCFALRLTKSHLRRPGGGDDPVRTRRPLRCEGGYGGFLTCRFAVTCLFTRTFAADGCHLTPGFAAPFAHGPRARVAIPRREVSGIGPAIDTRIASTDYRQRASNVACHRQCLLTGEPVADIKFRLEKLLSMAIAPCTSVEAGCSREAHEAPDATPAQVLYSLKPPVSLATCWPTHIGRGADEASPNAPVRTNPRTSEEPVINLADRLSRDLRFVFATACSPLELGHPISTDYLPLFFSSSRRVTWL